MSNRRVLLLNKSESVIDIVSWQNAVCLLVKGAAHAPFDYDHKYKIHIGITSAERMQKEGKFSIIFEKNESGEREGYFLIPTALVLNHFVHIPFKRVAINKKNVLKRDNHLCAYCGTHLSDSSGTIDHVLPSSRWKEFKKTGIAKGKTSHSWRNVVASCRKCNSKKDNKTPQEAGMELRRKPFVPSRDYLLLRSSKMDTFKMWERWINISL